MKTMKHLAVKKLIAQSPISAENAAQLLEEQTPLNAIDTINWPGYPAKPEVSFRIGHSGDTIWLKFDVREKYIRAQTTTTNGPVHLDSCVEFFLSFDGSNYYNFEFNCIGTRHVGYGNGRHNRHHLPTGIAETIRTASSLGTSPFDNREGDFSWEMVVGIPLNCLIFQEKITLEGRRAHANFYKCGDETPEPHFVTWNPVKTDQPDYHRPEFFGSVTFE